MAKRKYKKKSLPIRLGEVPTKERRTQLGGAITEVMDRDFNGKVYMLRYRAKYECMLDAYLIKLIIDKVLHEAGMRYRLAWLRVIEGLKVEDRFSTGGQMSAEDWLCMVSQNEKYLKDADAVLTPAQKRMILRVCVDDQRAGGTDALETLRRGLENLAKLWGMM